MIKIVRHWLKDMYKIDEMGESTQTHAINFCQKYLGNQRQNRDISPNYVRKEITIGKK